MAQPQLKFNEVKCSVPLFNKLVTLLHGLPYSQVAQMIEEIKQGFRPVLPAPKKDPKPVETEIVEETTAELPAGEPS